MVSMRLRVDLKSKSPIVFSYPELIKRQEKITKQDVPSLAATLETEQDSFYKGLLERAAKYDLNPGEEDVESDGDDDDEENIPNKDAKGNEYDYDDPFIDDSDMMLDEPYEYTEPEFDGFFVYRGPLDGSDSSVRSKKKSTSKKTSTTTAAATTTTASSGAAAGTSNGKAKSLSTNASNATASTAGVTSSSSLSAGGGTARKSVNRNETIEISDGEDNHVAKSAASKTKKGSSTPKSDTANKVSAIKKSSSSVTNSQTSSSTDGKKATVKTTKPAAAKSASASSTSSSTSVEVSKKGSAPASSNISSQVESKKTKATELLPLDPTIEPLMEQLRKDRANESFEVKSKFPPSLRPTVLEIGTRMFRRYRKVDDNVVGHLMSILPYNRFTLKKFLTTKAGPGSVVEMQKEIDELIVVLKDSVKEAMPEQLQQYEQKLAEQKNNPPADGLEVERKFRCNETIRRTLYNILTIDMYSTALLNEIAELSNKPEDVASETKARKAMYTRLLPCWPQNWMTTYDISRQYSTYKAKMKNVDESSSKVSSVGSSSAVAGTKRSASNPIKRSAPSTTTTTSASSSVSSTSVLNNSAKQTAHQAVGGGEKRKKLSNNESVATTNLLSNDETNKKGSKGANDANESTDGDNDRVIPVTNSGLQSSQKPSSMNIASLISGP